MLHEYYASNATRNHPVAKPPEPPKPPKTFDGATEQKVRQVQRENGLPETGRVDAETLRALDAHSPLQASPGLRTRVESHGLMGPGDQGSDIEELDAMLEGYANSQPSPVPPQGASMPPLHPLAEQYIDNAQKAQDPGNLSPPQGGDPANRPVEAAIYGLNSDGDKALVKIKGNAYAGIDMGGMGKKVTKPIEKAVPKAVEAGKNALGNLDRLKRPGSSWFDKVVNKGVGSTHAFANGILDKVQGTADKAVKPIADLVDSINIGQKVGGELNAEVSAKQNAAGGLEYEVKIKKAVDTTTVAALPVKLEGWGAEMDVNGELGKGVAMEETYTFKSKEEAIKGLEALKMKELLGDQVLTGKSGDWLEERKTWTNIEITQNLSGGVTGKQEDLKLPSWVPDLGVVGLSGAREVAGKVELSTKVTYKFSEQPGVANQVVRELKGVTKSEVSARLEGDVADFKGTAGVTATPWENEFTIETKDEFHTAGDFAKLLDNLPKEVEIKASSTRFQDTWLPDGTRMDSTKVEYAKTIPFDQIKLGQESGLLLRTLTGNTGDAKAFEDAGYKTSRKHVDASGFSGQASLGVTIPVEMVPVTLAGGISVEVGRDDSTKVG